MVLKYLLRKGSSSNDAVEQMQDQFHNEGMTEQFLLDKLDQIPPASEDASQLRATVNGIMAIFTPCPVLRTILTQESIKATFVKNPLNI